MRGIWAASSDRSIPAFSARLIRAPSVGSPTTDQVPVSSWLRAASLHSTAAVANCCTSDRSRTSTPSPASVNPPSGAYPTPDTNSSVPGSMTRTAVISLRVRVPVLSEQITETEPRVSTAGSRRTIARSAAIARVPIASTIVMIAGRPSGIAATARPTTARKASIASIPPRNRA